MFCKYCGNEIADDSAFCSKCGKRLKEESTDYDLMGENVANENETADEQEGAPKEDSPNSDSTAKDVASENDDMKKTGSTSIDDVVNETVENTNPLCLAGLVLTIVMFFFNYHYIVGFAALIISFFGYREAKKNGQKGTTLAVVCMVVSGIASIAFVGLLLEYRRYESAVYGGVSGFLDLLGDLIDSL